VFGGGGVKKFACAGSGRFDSVVALELGLTACMFDE